MATIADKYYITALDYYPYELGTSLENLNYALSSDSMHSGANHLMGLLHMEYIKDFHKAERYLQKALAGDPENLNVCYSLAELFIKIRDFEKADKLISYTNKIRGADMGKLNTLKALKYEYRKMYQESIEYLYKALDEVYDDDFSEYLNNIIRRVEEKMNRNSVKIFK